MPYLIELPSFGDRDPKAISGLEHVATGADCTLQVRCVCNIKFETGIVQDFAAWCIGGKQANDISTHPSCRGFALWLVADKLTLHGLLVALGRERDIIPPSKFVLHVPNGLAYTGSIRNSSIGSK